MMPRRNPPPPAPAQSATTSHNRSTAMPSLTASARNAPNRIPPADFASLLEATNADASPATTLTKPPAAADTAVCAPASNAAATVIAAVAASCQCKTVRIGLPRWRSMALVLSAPSKAAKLYTSAQLLEQLLEMVEARVVQHEFAGALFRRTDLDRSAEPLRHFLFQPREIAVGPLAAPRCRAAQQALHQRLGLAHRQALRRDARAGFDLPRRVERDQSARMPHLERAFQQHFLHRPSELEQPQHVRGGAARAADRIGRLLVRHLELVDQALQSRRLFHRIEVLALDVLDERHRERGFIRHFAH